MCRVAKITSTERTNNFAHRFFKSPFPQLERWQLPGRLSLAKLLALNAAPGRKAPVALRKKQITKRLILKEEAVLPLRSPVWNRECFDWMCLRKTQFVKRTPEGVEA